MGYYGYAPYVSIAEKARQAERWVKKMHKQGVELSPIPRCIKLGKSWWGKAWNKNLESYAELKNRIGRGKSYISNGFVVDFNIERGKAYGLVAGSGSKPYEVSVAIYPLSDAKIKEIETLCGRRIDSLEGLLSGNFPKDLGPIFAKYLFPTSK